MARRIRLEPHLAVDELERRYRAAREPHERSWWQILWLLARGHIAREVAAGMPNRQYTRSHRAAPVRSAEQLAELARAVRGPAPEGDEWLGRTVAAWMSQKLGRPVSVQLGWVYLVRLDGKRRKPRPRH